MILPGRLRRKGILQACLDYPCRQTRVCRCALFWVKGVRKWRQESPARWFAPLAALLMVVSLSGCFDKEGDQRKAFIDFLQNTVMRSGERLPTLTADQKTVWSFCL